MVEKRATIVKEFLGWAATTDKQFALLGFRDQHDKEFNIAIPEGALKQAIISLINSTSAFKKLSMEGGGDVVISTDWFEFGDSEQGKFLRLRLVPSGGHLTFSLPGQMAANMRDVLVGALGQAESIPPPPEGQKN